MKEIGLLIYMMGVLLIASPERFGFKEETIPLYHHRVFDKDRIGQKLLKLEKSIKFGPISKKDEEESWTVTKPKRDWKFYIESKMLELKYSLKPLPNYKTHGEWMAYIRKRTLDILYKYFNMEESDFVVTKEAKVKLVGEKNVVAADWVYRKYGIPNPRPTFIRTKNELGDEIYVIECPPEWEDDVIFAPIDFTKITVKLKVPLYKKMVDPVLAGCIVVLAFVFSPMIILGLAKKSPVSGSFRYDDFTEILNVKDYGVIGDGVADDTTAIDTLFTDPATATYFFPNGTYLVDYIEQSVGGYNENVGPWIHDNSIVVGEGDRTVFQAARDELYIFGLHGDNILLKDFKSLGTGSGNGTTASSGTMYWRDQPMNMIRYIGITANDHVGPAGINSRGLTILGTGPNADIGGHLMQDCRMSGNQHGFVGTSPGTRVVSCFSMDNVEKNYYVEGDPEGYVMMSCTSDGTGGSCYAYINGPTATDVGSSFTGNVFCGSGIGPEPYGGARGGTDMVFSNNVCNGVSTGLYPQTYRCHFIGNVIMGCSSNGISLFTKCDRNQFIGNSVTMCGADGVTINGQNSYHHNNFIGNTIIDNIATRGMNINNCDYTMLSFNKIYSSDTGTYHTAHGVRMSSTAHYTYFIGNDLRSAGAAIYVDDSETCVWGAFNLMRDW